QCVALLESPSFPTRRSSDLLVNIGADSYQAKQSAKALQEPDILWGTFCKHLFAILDNFQVSGALFVHWKSAALALALVAALMGLDRKSTRLNSSHLVISYAV